MKKKPRGMNLSSPFLGACEIWKLLHSLQVLCATKRSGESAVYFSHCGGWRDTGKEREVWRMRKRGLEDHRFLLVGLRQNRNEVR